MEREESIDLTYVYWLQLTNTITFEICHTPFELHYDRSALRAIRAHVLISGSWGAEQLLSKLVPGTQKHRDVVSTKAGQQATRTADLHRRQRK
jgi:hypothetical protein